ncbi:MAG TPA: sulfite exporter TauE/SafE family protein [Burkholderiaceae bacterium]|nr:sulfite exporter TauE/SafE family protein [Burkholderiaceae bacterium]
MDAQQSVTIGVVFMLAGVVKGISGMGLPTVAMSLLGLLMAPAQAAALLVLPSLATNVAQCRGPALRTLARHLWPLWLALVLATVFMPRIGLGGSGGHARTFLGVVLLVYGAWGLWRPALPRIDADRPVPAISAGALTGAVTAATAVFVIPMVPYLQALRLDKDTMIQALGLSFTIATLALALRLQRADALPALSPLTGLALLSSFVGLWLGARLRAKFSQQVFQRALFVVFLALGVANLWRGS